MDMSELATNKGRRESEKRAEKQQSSETANTCDDDGTSELIAQACGLGFTHGWNIW